MERKKFLNELKLILSLIVVGPSLTGCTINIDDSIFERLGIKVSMDEDGNINIEDIENSETTTCTSYTQTLESTTATLPFVTTSKNATTTNFKTTLSTTSTTSTSVSTSTSNVVTTTSTSVNPYVISHIDFDMKYCHDWYENLNFDFFVENNDIEVSIGQQFPGMWSISNYFHPEGMTIDEFVKELLDYNNLTDKVYHNGQKIKVPGRFLVYNGNLGLEDLSIKSGVSLNKLYVINNLSYTDEVNHRFENRNLIIRSLSKDAQFFEYDDAKYNIINDKAFCADKLFACNPYSSKNDFSVVSLYSNDYGMTSCFVDDVNKDGTYNHFKIADNVNKVHIVGSIPVFETCSSSLCYAKSIISKYVPEAYETVINMKNQEYFNSIYFYMDDKENIYFTFYPDDLTMYGFKKADEEAYRYFRHERYFYQDESGISFLNTEFNPDLYNDVRFSSDEFYKSNQKVK